MRFRILEVVEVVLEVLQMAGSHPQLLCMLEARKLGSVFVVSKFPWWQFSCYGPLLLACNDMALYGIEIHPSSLVS